MKQNWTATEGPRVYWCPYRVTFETRTSFAGGCRLVRNLPINATESGGVSVSVNGEHTLEALLEYSDVALYCAKTEGRRIKHADKPMPDTGSSNVFRVA